MKTRTLGVIILVVTVLVLMAGVAGAIPGGTEPEDAVAEKINYQGWLTDLGGTPLNGTYPMQFQLYDDEVAGAMYWESGLIDVEVDHGRFSVDLDVNPGIFDGKALWVRIYVNGEWLSPRQEVLPVPYALSLRPGGQIVGDTPHGWGVEVFQLSDLATGGAVRGTSATGTAIQGYSQDGFGLAGYSHDSYGVYGYDGGSEQARGYGGYFYSANGVGVYGFSNALSVAGNAYTPGVYGRSANGVGVYGLSDNASAGVFGQSDGTGVYGRTQGTDVSDYGVYGAAGGLAYGVYGYQYNGVSGLGVYGENEGGGSGVSGLNGGTGNGTWGYSTSYNGIGGMTGRGDNNYGLYTQDNLYSLNYHTPGAVMQIAQNADDEPLEYGDVVVIAGVGQSPADGNPPLLQVRQAREANSSGVVGVVASAYPAEWLTEPGKTDPTGADGPETSLPLAEADPTAPGDYLLVVIQGPCQMKVDATTAAIQPGDLLSSMGQGGVAAKAPTINVGGTETTVPGTVLGKAMEPLDEGQALLYVFVTLQ